MEQDGTVFRYFKRKEFNLVRIFVAFCVETVSRSLIRRSVERELLSTRGRNYDGVNRETIYPSEFFICYLFRDARNVPVSFIQQLLVRKRTAPEAAKTELGKESPLERDDRTIRVSYSAFARTSRDRSIYGAQRFDQTPFFLLLLLLSSNVKESIVIERWIRSWVG